jgi:formamidopyrimidine-DNA glycosylase
MPELPEITIFARDMQEELVGRTISGIEVFQPKCLNVTEEEFRAALAGAQIRDVSSHGKWLLVDTTRGWLLLGLGMGGEILLTGRDRLPEKTRLIFDLTDGACLAVNFWWLYSQLTKPPLRRYIGHRSPFAPLQRRVSRAGLAPQ